MSDTTPVAIYARARTVHLERFSEMGIRLIYRTRNYDFDQDLAARLSARELGYGATVRYLWKNAPSTVEVNEPFQLNAWPGLFLYLTTIRIKDFLTRRHTRIVTYAIGNDDLVANVMAYTRLPRPVATVLTKAAMRYLFSRYDRVAFGIPDSRRLYQDICGRTFARPETRMFGALAPRHPGPVPEDRPRQLVFLGALEERKGIRKLMAAWPSVGGVGSRLVILGKGPLADEVEAWAASREDVGFVRDPSRATISETLLGSSALILFSQRTPRWREQIGLPILEALSHGCTVIASTETGVAEWLEENGHTVLPPSATPEELANAIERTLDRPRPVAEVLRTLPEKDMRLIAADWMFGVPCGRAETCGAAA